MTLTNIKEIIERKHGIEKEIQSIENQICLLPEGKLVCVHNGKYQKWYQSDGHTSIYIPKKKRNVAEKLAAKKYLSLKMQELKSELTVVNAFLEQNSNAGKAEKMLEIPEYADLLSGYFKPQLEETKEWVEESYEKCSKYPEQLIYKTCTGIMVRSKSEMIIAMFLHVNKIPFRYESTLHLGEQTIYPDFTIKHPKTGKIYYYEHFGMMDNPSYCKNALSKIQLYISNGIFPSTQLITTFETQKQPLDMKTVEDVLRKYFLE